MTISERAGSPNAKSEFDGPEEGASTTVSNNWLIAAAGGPVRRLPSRRGCKAKARDNGRWLMHGQREASVAIE